MSRPCRLLMAGPLLAALTLIAPARGQAIDAALKDRVAQLVEKLDAKKAEDRDAAQAALIKLGARIAALLPEPAKDASAELKSRLAKVKEAFAEELERVNFQATRVTLKGDGLRLSEAVKQLQARTNNAITDLREAMGADATNPSLTLDIADKPFFEALDLVAKEAGVRPYFFTGDGSIGLMAGSGGPNALPDQIGVDPPKPLVAYSGPFRVTLSRFSFSADYATGSSAANAQFEVAWEPRMRPMLLTLKAEDVEILDGNGTKVLPSVTAETGSVVLRQENPVVEMNVNMDTPDLSTKKFSRLKVKAEVTVPAAVRTYKFPTIAVKKEVVKKEGDVAVVLEGTEVEESVWKVRVRVDMPQEGPAFESYRQGLFNNRIFLQTADGTRFEQNGGFNNVGGPLSFEYLFVDAPGKPADHQLIYETPGKVITIPLEFEFKDVKFQPES
jgi:hypothetical protein